MRNSLKSFLVSIKFLNIKPSGDWFVASVISYFLYHLYSVLLFTWYFSLFQFWDSNLFYLITQECYKEAHWVVFLIFLNIFYHMFTIYWVKKWCIFDMPLTLNPTACSRVTVKQQFKTLQVYWLFIVSLVII